MPKNATSAPPAVGLIVAAEPEFLQTHSRAGKAKRRRMQHCYSSVQG